MSLRRFLLRLLLPAAPELVHAPTSDEAQAMIDRTLAWQMQGRQAAPISCDEALALLTAYREAQDLAERADHPLLVATINAPDMPPAQRELIGRILRDNPRGPFVTTPDVTITRLDAPAVRWSTPREHVAMWWIPLLPALLSAVCGIATMIPALRGTYHGNLFAGFAVAFYAVAVIGELTRPSRRRPVVPLAKDGEPLFPSVTGVANVGNVVPPYFRLKPDTYATDPTTHTLTTSTRFNPTDAINVVAGPLRFHPASAPDCPCFECERKRLTRDAELGKFHAAEVDRLAKYLSHEHGLGDVKDPIGTAIRLLILGREQADKIGREEYHAGLYRVCPRCGVTDQAREDLLATRARKLGEDFARLPEKIFLGFLTGNPDGPPVPTAAAHDRLLAEGVPVGGLSVGGPLHWELAGMTVRRNLAGEWTTLATDADAYDETKWTAFGILAIHPASPRLWNIARAPESTPDPTEVKLMVGDRVALTHIPHGPVGRNACLESWLVDDTRRTHIGTVPLT